MTREQFEAHVRAEAIVKYLSPFPSERREVYIATRMEHEWPLVEALQGITHSEWSALSLRNFARAALSPYTTKHIEP